MNKKEKKIQFSQRISELLKNISKMSLVVSVLTFGHAQGDVTDEPAVSAILAVNLFAGNESAAFINWLNGIAPLAAGVGRPANAAAYMGAATPPAVFGMRAAAAFFAGGAIHSCWAEKRANATAADLALIPNNNNQAAGGVPLSYHPYQHVERQAAIGVLAAAAGAPQVAEGGVRLNAAPLAPNIGGVAGSLHVWAHEQPCPNIAADAGNISCIDWYRNLPAVLGGIPVHVYVRSDAWSLNKQRFANNIAERNALCTQLAAILPAPPVPVLVVNSLTCAGAPGARIISIWNGANWQALMNEGPVGTWTAAGGPGRITILRTAVNGVILAGPQGGWYTANWGGQALTAMFGVANLTFHCF